VTTPLEEVAGHMIVPVAEDATQATETKGMERYWQPANRCKDFPWKHRWHERQHFSVPWQNLNKQQFLKTVGVLEEHIDKTFEYPQDIASVCKKSVIVPLVKPPNLTKQDYEDGMGKRMIWESQMKTYMKRTDMMVSNIQGIYAIMWGQCSP
jgi:hypothetical protein